MRFTRSLEFVLRNGKPEEAAKKCCERGLLKSEAVFQSGRHGDGVIRECDEQGGIKMNKHAMVIRVLGGIFILLSVLFLAPEALIIHRWYRIALYALLLISGVGLLFLKEWARTLAFVSISGMLLLNFIFIKALMRHNALLAELPLIAGFIFVMFYFNNSKVKEQFKRNKGAENTRRPGWVWIISIYYFFSAISSLTFFQLAFLGEIPLPPVQKAFFESLTFTDWSLSTISWLTALIGAVLFFYLRKRAYYFFMASLVVGTWTVLWNIVGKGSFQTFGAGTTIGRPIGMLISWGMLLAVCVYTKRLEKKGLIS